MRFFTTLLTILLSLTWLHSQSLEQFVAQHNEPDIDSLLYIAEYVTLRKEEKECFEEIEALRRLWGKSGKIEHLALHYLFLGLAKARYFETPNVIIPTFQKGVSLLKDNKEKSLWLRNLEAVMLNSLGIYMSVNMEGKETEAIEYMLKGHHIMSLSGYDQMQGAFFCLSNIGEAYHKTREFGMAIKNFDEAAKYIGREKRNRTIINYYNTYGLTLGRINQNEKAIQMFRKIPTYVIRRQDSIWIGLSHGNIANELYLLKRYGEAEPNLLVDIEYSFKYKDTCSAMESLLLLGKILSKGKRFGEALSTLTQSEALLAHCNSPPSWQHLHETRAIYYYEKGDFQKAFESQAEGYAIKDSIRKALNEKQIKTVSLKMENERQQAQLQLLEKEKSSAKTQRNLLIFLMLALGAASFFIMRALRSKNQRQKIERELIEYKLNVELQRSHDSLDEFKGKLIQKNELIEKFEEELSNFPPNEHVEHKDKILEKLSKSKIATNQDWVQFVRSFEQVYPNFSAKLKEKYPGLSQTEVRLLILTKLNFNAKDMASLLGLTIDAIHKSRHRLRKKLNLSGDDNLLDVLER